MEPHSLPKNISTLDDIQRQRLQTLLSVDEMVEKIVSKLRNLQILDNTYVIFTSDNGFHIGKVMQKNDFDSDVKLFRTIHTTVG